MDISLVTSSVWDLPSSQRVDVIVHDGSADLRPWPGPGSDRELVEHYGRELNDVLARERERLPDKKLPLGEVRRLHRGRLHCDFFLWVATRPPEARGVRAEAPRADLIRTAVRAGLEFVRERRVARVAFGPLGEGPNAIDDVERLVLIARAANEFYDECFAAGRATGVEDMLICHPFSSTIANARRKLGRAVSLPEPPRRTAPTAPSRSAPRKTRKAAAPTGRTRKGATRSAAGAVLTMDEAAQARATGKPYDRTRKWDLGELMMHSKFGPGRVYEITPEGFILVIFEAGVTKRLLHDRP